MFSNIKQMFKTYLEAYRMLIYNEIWNCNNYEIKNIETNNFTLLVHVDRLAIGFILSNKKNQKKDLWTN